MRKREELTVQRVGFLGEQDGVPEGELKRQLTELFHKQQAVVRAYLARVEYEATNEFNVAISLNVNGKLTRRLDRGINRVFAKMFRTDEHLDVLALTDEQEVALRRVCLPFFKRPEGE